MRQLYNTASPGSLKKLYGIHREGIIIYIGAFRTSLVETLHVEANGPPLELRKNELGLPYTWPSGWLGTPNEKLSYTKLNHTSKSGKIHTTIVGNTRLNWVGYVLDTLD